jgi:predicted phage-related endonuclease
MNAPVSKDALFRAAHVGAGEVAALFDASPWLTHFELYHRKTGTIAVPEFNAVSDDGNPENERIYWGVKLEAAIIDAAKERYGYIDREPADPPLSNGKGLGGHPDRRVICPQRGPGVVEVKMADWLVRKSWGDEPPLNYLLQSQTYQGLDGVTWGDVLVLVGGNKLERFQYDFRPKLYAEIEKRVEAFWASVHAGKPPPADYTRDGETIREIYADSDGAVIDLKLDNLAHIAAAEFLRADAESKEAAKRRDAAKAELMEKLGHAEVALLDGFTIKAATVKAIPDTVITPDMVGNTINGRKSYRRFAVKEKEAK